MTLIPAKPRHVSILGSGVIGLSIAHVLTSQPNAAERYKVTIMARELVEDMTSQAWSSPWAGANWSAIGGLNERMHRWEKETIDKWFSMVPDGLAMVLPTKQYSSDESALDKIWYQDLVKNFKVMNADEVLEPFKVGVTFETASVNPTIYLPFLQKQLKDRGVEFQRKTVKSLWEAFSLMDEDGVLVNATGLGARSLLGVEDNLVYPVRGQTIHAYAPGIKGYYSGDNHDTSESTYIIPRPGDDTIIIGGTYQINNWDTSLDLNIADKILKRCAALEPSLLTDHRVRVLSHNVGLRPSREGGPRVEVEWVVPSSTDPILPPKIVEASKHIDGKKKPVVHAYGFGGAGYQNSWGAANEVASLIEQIVQNLSDGTEN